jgi:hypothetical protein
LKAQDWGIKINLGFYTATTPTFQPFPAPIYRHQYKNDLGSLLAALKSTETVNYFVFQHSNQLFL